MQLARRVSVFVSASSNRRSDSPFDLAAAWERRARDAGWRSSGGGESGSGSGSGRGVAEYAASAAAVRDAWSRLGAEVRRAWRREAHKRDDGRP